MKTIDTPYGRKTPELLCYAMDALTAQPDMFRDLEMLCDVVLSEYPESDDRYALAVATKKRWGLK